MFWVDAAGAAELTTLSDVDDMMSLNITLTLKANGSRRAREWCLVIGVHATTRPSYQRRYDLALCNLFKIMKCEQRENLKSTLVFS